jgi:D-alanyl-D-alanine carboxypeptidase
MDLPPVPPDYAIKMPPMAEASELVSVQVDQGGRIHQLCPRAAKAWTKMQSAATTAGVELILLSAFRSVSRQRSIVLRKLECGESLVEILKVNAFPGHREHHTGNAIDLGSPDSPELEEAFEKTAEFKWLVTPAPAHSFSMSYPRNNRSGVIHEPWHWLFMG